jgi:hypothetical protein
VDTTDYADYVSQIGSIKFVQYFWNNVNIGKAIKAPYELEWLVVPGRNGIPSVGNIEIQIIAKDQCWNSVALKRFKLQVLPAR